MKQSIFVTLDVGGTFIKSGVVDGQGNLLRGSLLTFPSNSSASAKEIIDHLTGILVSTIRAAQLKDSYEIAGIAIAFPGPFDYDQGISYIRGLDKYEALYGLRVGDMLMHRLRSDPFLAGLLLPNVKVLFENDAAMFAIGESYYGKAAGYDRSICLTLGTGIGSGFMEQGKLIKHSEHIPENGWVHSLPYGSLTADDVLSRRGILQLAAEMHLDVNGKDVKELALLAMEGGIREIELFNRFGQRLYEVLMQPIAAFDPNIIVLGGQIAKSGSLFISSFYSELHRAGIQTIVVTSNNTLHSTLKGGFRLLQFR